MTPSSRLLLLAVLALTGCPTDDNHRLSEELAALRKEVTELKAAVARLEARPTSTPTLPREEPAADHSALGALAVLVVEKLAGAADFSSDGTISQPAALAALQQHKVSTVVSQLPAADLHTARQGELPVETVKAMLGGGEAQRLLFLKVTSQDAGNIMNTGLHSYAFQAEVRIIDVNGRVLATGTASNAVPCVAANVAPPSCRSMFEKRVVGPAVRQALDKLAAETRAVAAKP
ncbi:MAG: hypothetical protein AB2A00_31330 [Myxococcota bacterium]